MTTNIRSAFLVGSGVLVDITTSVTVADTRIRSIHATGSGIYVLDGTSTTALGTIAGNIVKFDVAYTAGARNSVRSTEILMLNTCGEV